MYCWDISVQDDIVSFDLAIKEKNIEERYKVNNAIKIKGELTLQGSFSIKINKSTFLLIISKLTVNILSDGKAYSEAVKCKIFDNETHKLMSDGDTSFLSFEIVHTDENKYNFCIRLESILEDNALNSILGRNMFDTPIENRSFISCYSIDVPVIKMKEILREIENDGKAQLDITAILTDKNDIWDNLEKISVQAE